MFSNMAPSAAARVNCTPAFVKAQAACPSGSHIFIPDGTYLLSGAITLKSNVTWRGQSSTGTVIKFSGGGGFETASQWPSVSYKTGGVSVTAGATKGSRVLTVRSTATFKIGQMVQLTDLTPPYMHANSGNGWAAAPWIGYDETRLATIMFMVSKINSSAKTITLDHALPDRYDRRPAADSLGSAYKRYRVRDHDVRLHQQHE